MTLALFQQPICWEDPAANFRMVEQQLASLTSPVDIILLPETFSTGFSDNMARMADAPEGVTLDFARRMAARHDALFVATWTVRDANGAVYNRLHWVRPDGTYGCYDKAHTFRMSSGPTGSLLRVARLAHTSCCVLRPAISGMAAQSIRCRCRPSRLRPVAGLRQLAGIASSGMVDIVARPCH